MPRRRLRARPELHEAGLGEVSVEGEGIAQSEPAHQDEAGAVGEAEVLVGEPLERRPRLFDHLRRHGLDTHAAAHTDIIAETDGYPVPGAVADDRVTLIR